MRHRTPIHTPSEPTEQKSGRDGTGQFSRQWLANILRSKPLVFGLWGLVILGVLDVVSGSSIRLERSDFTVFYASAVALRHGLDPYATDLTPIGNQFGMSLGELLHSTDTPTALAFFEPLSFLAPGKALALWLILNAAALTAALILLLQPKYSGLSSSTAWTVAALALLYQPTVENFAYAQRQPLVLLLIVMTMRALKDGREAAGGLLLAVAGAYRVFPLIIAGYLVVRRNWRALAFMVLGLIFIGTLTIAALGLHICISYIDGIHYALIDEFTIDSSNVSLRAFIVRLGWSFFGYHVDWRTRWCEQIASALMSAAVVLITVKATLRHRSESAFDQRGFCLWIATAVMLSPLSWIHYMILLLIPFIAIVSAAERDKCSTRTIAALVVAYLITSVDVVLRDKVAAGWQGLSFIFVGEFAFACLLVGFLATYWFATDDPVRSQPAARSLAHGTALPR